MAGERNAVALLMLIAGMALPPQPAAAFCIANGSEERLAFEVDVDGKGRNAPFRRGLNPGQEACCDWQRRACNVARDPDAMLRFAARREVGVVEWTCYHSARADARVTMRHHVGANGCRWHSAAAGSSGGATGLWDRVMQILDDLL